MQRGLPAYQWGALGDAERQSEVPVSTRDARKDQVPLDEILYGKDDE